MFDIVKYLTAFLDLVERSKDSQLRAYWVAVRDKMVVHTRGVKPVGIINTSRPNEPDNILGYRLANYRAITKDPINKGIDDLYRIVLNSNYVFRPSPNIKEYLETKRFTPQDFLGNSESLTFEQYILKVCLRAMIDDPNGALVWLPVNSENPELLPAENDPTKPIEVEPVLISSSRIIDASRNVFSWVAAEKWAFNSDGIKDGKKDTKAPYYFVTNKETLYRLIPVKVVEGAVKYQEEVYYQLANDPVNAFPFTPYIILGGELVESLGQHEETFFYYDSFFSGYVEFGNEAINAFSDDQGVRVRMNFPIIEEKGQICSECQGAGKVSRTDPEISGKSVKRVTCPTCKGRRVVVSKSPYSTYIIQPPKSGDNTDFTNRPSVSFLSPDVSILERSNRTWREFLEDAKEAINLRFIDEAQSGKAKEIDREQKYNKLFKISKNIFENLYRKSHDLIEAYRTPVASQRKEAVIITPTNFQIKTTKDLTDEVTELKKNNSPAPLIVKGVQTLSHKLYNNDTVNARVMDILAVWDPLLPFDPQQINQLKAAGGLDDKAIIKNVNAYSILTILSNREGFLNWPLDKVIEEANKLLEEIVKSMEPPTPILVP